MKSSKSWIAITLSLLALGACDKREAVFVDLNRAETLLAIQPAESVELAPLNASLPPTQSHWELPPTPPLYAEAGARAERVGALLKEQLETTEQELLAAFEKDALIQASTEIATLRSALGDTLGEFDSRLLEEASAIIQSRATERGRMLARLAFLAGFPPGKTRKSNVPWPTALNEDWAREADQLREKLRAWDQETYMRLDELVATHHNLQTSARERVQKAIEAIRSTARQSAVTRAQEVMTSVGGIRLDDLMADEPLVPPTVSAGDSVQVAATRLNVSAIHSSAETGGSAARQRAQRHLEIFLRLHGYKLAQPGQGKDATGEFITWLQKRLSGHSQN